MNPAKKAPDETTYGGRFAARLRMLREKAGLTGPEMAERLNECGHSTTATTYYRWETAVSVPPLAAFPALAKALGASSPRTLLPKE